MEQVGDAPAHPRPRLIGAVYLLYFLVGTPSLIILRGVVHQNDALATANAILANEPMYQLGISLDLVSNVIYLALTALFYNLLEPVGRRVALIMALVSLAGCTLQMFDEVFKIAPLVMLKSAQLMSAFQPEQVRATTLVSFKMYSQLYTVSLVLFAFFDLSIGWLIIRSTFLPWIIGALMMCAGVSGLVFLWPPVASPLAAYLPMVAGVPELLMMLWLIVMGVNVEKWRRRTVRQT